MTINSDKYVTTRASMLAAEQPPQEPFLRYTVNPAFPRLANAVKRAQLGQGHTLIMMNGDSTVAGYNTIARAGSFPTKFALEQVAQGGGTWGNNYGGGANSTYDPRLTAQANWSLLAEFTLGGRVLQNVTNANYVQFSPGYVFDSIDIAPYSNGSLLVSLWDGTKESPQVTLTGDTGDFYKPYTLRVAQFGWPAGNYSVRYRRNGTSQPKVSSINCYMAASSLVIANTGVSSWTLLNWLTGGNISPASTIPNYDPDYILHDIGINDYNKPSPTPEATFKAQYQQIIDLSKSKGADVQLVIPNRIGGVHANHQFRYERYIREISAANGMQPPIDIPSVLGSFDEATAHGYMATLPADLGALHPSPLGNQLIAKLVANTLFVPRA